eukprot:TRINITY_DN38260_c0_g1_i1.p1 TRINITY_DN38260_c0_g1~~TRINITY_DN38260_c0_g1_i1.p1  ORF type:complete len:1442 (-),score=297.90 TRINITY_DN38260_c0_g1_i1:128-4453(-)
MDDDEDEVCCRICRQGEEIGKLYCPCKCTGSIKWIHESCLKQWLEMQDSHRRVCELCRYSFEFVPVYAQHAPQSLTALDWAAFLWSSLLSGSRRFLRILYATMLWGVALPLLTVYFGRRVYLGSGASTPAPEGSSAAASNSSSLWGTLTSEAVPFTANVFLGFCLSLTGLGAVSLQGFVSRMRLSAAPEPGAEQQRFPGDAGDAAIASGGAGANTLAHGPAPGGGGDMQRPLAGEAAQTNAAPAVQQAAPPAAPAAGEQENLDDVIDPDEDLWSVMGLQGSLVRAFLCVSLVILANIVGICIFLGIPFHLGRATLEFLVPILAYARRLYLNGDDLITSGGVLSALRAMFSRSRSRVLPHPGQDAILDLGSLLVGYMTIVVLPMILVPSLVLVGAAFGCNSREMQVMRAGVAGGLSQARHLSRTAWLKLQLFAAIMLHLMLVPCCIGHVVVCLLCGPVLHMPQHVRAGMANSNLPLTVMMQLFIGYVHLWGMAFLEGIVSDICSPALARLPSTNFFLCALCSHRRLFGTEAAENDSVVARIPWLVPRMSLLKMSLVHLLFHLPLVFVLWYLPACLLDVAFGDSLFPVHLLDKAAGAWTTGTTTTTQAGSAFWQASAKYSPWAPAPPASSSVGGLGNSLEKGGAAGMDDASAPYFAVEMLQLYILVLQCLRVLDASPGLARLVAGGMQAIMRKLGCQRLLNNGDSSSPGPQVQQLASTINTAAAASVQADQLAAEAASRIVQLPPAAAQALGQRLQRLLDERIQQASDLQQRLRQAGDLQVRLAAGDVRLEGLRDLRGSLEQVRLLNADLPEQLAELLRISLSVPRTALPSMADAGGETHLDDVDRRSWSSGSEEDAEFLDDDEEEPTGGASASAVADAGAAGAGIDSNAPGAGRASAGVQTPWLPRPEAEELRARRLAALGASGGSSSSGAVAALGESGGSSSSSAPRLTPEPRAAFRGVSVSSDASDATRMSGTVFFNIAGSSSDEEADRLTDEEEEEANACAGERNTPRTAEDASSRPLIRPAGLPSALAQNPLSSARAVGDGGPASAQALAAQARAAAALYRLGAQGPPAARAPLAPGVASAEVLAAAQARAMAGLAGTGGGPPPGRPAMLVTVQSQHTFYPTVKEIAVVAAILLTLSWSTVMLVLSLPLTIGRLIVRCIMSAQAKHISDFLPLSLGVVVFSAGLLLFVKVVEAAPAIVARAAVVEQRRCVHFLLCAISASTVALAALVLVPFGLGCLAMRIVLPLKSHSVYLVPVLFVMTDCWSLGLVITKVLWRLVQTDIVFHSMHTEMMAIQTSVGGSFTDLFFDLGAHLQIWKKLLLPPLEVIVIFAVFPQAIAETAIMYGIPETQEYLRAFVSMYCYHAVLGLGLAYFCAPLVRHWLSCVRQRIYDSKYLEARELQNYHPAAAAEDSAPREAPQSTTRDAAAGAAAESATIASI